MALTTVTVSPFKTHQQPGTFGARRARLVTATFTAGYDSATGCTITAASCGLSEIYGILPLGAALGTAKGAQVAVTIGSPASTANLVLYNGTALVATADESATTIALLVYGV